MILIHIMVNTTISTVKDHSGQISVCIFVGLDARFFIPLFSTVLVVFVMFPCASYSYSINTVTSYASGSSVKFNLVDIKKVLEKWKLISYNSSYKFYSWIEVSDGYESSNHVANAANKKGRYFEIPIVKL